MAPPILRRGGRIATLLVSVVAMGWRMVAGIALGVFLGWALGVTFPMVAA